MFDNLWGVSFDEYEDDEEGACASIFEGKQKNLLGYALMKARHKILNPQGIKLSEVHKSPMPTIRKKTFEDRKSLVEIPENCKRTEDRQKEKELDLANSKEQQS